MTGLGNCIPSTGADPPHIGEGQAQGSVSAPGGLGGLGLMEVGITPLLYNRTWCLSPLKVLLQQAECDILLPRPQDLDLPVWPVRETRSPRQWFDPRSHRYHPGC